MAIIKTIEVETELRGEQTDLRPCSFCEDMIFSDMFRLIVKVGQGPKSRESKSEIVVCESCKNVYESKNK